MEDIIEKFLNSSNNNVTFDMKVKAIQDLDGVIFNSTHLKNMSLFDNIIDVTAKHLKSTQYKTTYEILVFLSHMNQYLSQQDNMAQYFRIYIPKLYAIALEKLGDSKEKIRELTSVYILEVMQLASYFPREKFNLVIEKEFRTALATTKFFRVKEQLILLVAESYKSIQGFQIQYYIPNVVQSLEDSNEVVRSTSKEAIIDIIKYSQNRPEVIRHIKRELVKNRVRQTIIDSIFSQVTVPEEDIRMESPVSKSRSLNSNPHSNVSSPQLSSNSGSYENLPGLGVKSPPPNYPPPPPPQKSASTPSPATNNNSTSSSPVNNAVIFKFPGKRTVSQDVAPVHINSEKEYETALRNMLPIFQEKESENNWEKRERFMKQLRGMIRGGAADFDGNCRIIKLMLEPIMKTTHSLRTTLAITTIGTIIEMAENYKTQMDPIAEAVITNLLDLTSQTKKLIATSSTQAIYIILRNISYNPKILTLFMNALSDKNANTRSSTSLFIGVMFEEMVKSDNSKAFLIRSGGLDMIEKCIKKGLQDANPSVRETSRSTYLLLNNHWKDRATALMNTLDITTRKALMRTLNSHGSSSSAVSTPSPKPIRRTKITNSPALGEPFQSKRQGSGSEASNFARGKSQPVLGSPKLTGTPKRTGSANVAHDHPSPTPNFTGQQHIRTPGTMSPQRMHTAPTLGYGSNTSSPRNSVSSPSKPSIPANPSTGIKIENSSLLQSMNKALNSSKDDPFKPKLMHPPIIKSSPEASKEALTTSPLSVHSPTRSPSRSNPPSAVAPPPSSSPSSPPQVQTYSKKPSSSAGSSPTSEKGEPEVLSPIASQILAKLRDMDWKNRVSGLEDLLNYITSPEYVPSPKLTKTYLSLFRDPSPYILNVIFKPTLLQAVVESRFVSLDKLIPKIYSVIEPPDEKTGEFDDISKTAYDAILWLKSKIRKNVILDSLLMCLENKLNNQPMTETVFEGILSWLVEIIDRSPDSREEVQRYFSQRNNYNVALEELLELLLRREDNHSINNVYIIKLIQSLQELNPTSYDDVMSEYAENLQFIILKRIHNNDYDLSDIEREFIEKELSGKPNNKFRESHLFENSLSLEDPKSKLLTEETVPDGFSDLTISRNTSLKTGLEMTEDHSSEHSSFLNEFVSKSWHPSSVPTEPTETGRDSTLKNKSDLSDPQSTPKLTYQKDLEMEEEHLLALDPLQTTTLPDTIPLESSTQRPSPPLLPQNLMVDGGDDRLPGLNQQFKLLIDIIQESNEIDHDILDIKVFRRLIRYSREYPLKSHTTKEKNLSGPLWDQWFNPLYHHLYQYINNETNVKNLENYENCILLIKHLIINQTSKFEGKEQQTMQILVKCRSLNIDEVCSASEDTIEALCEELSSEKNLKACMALLDQEEFIAQSPLSSESTEYRPSYMGTLYMILSKILPSVELTWIQQHLSQVMEMICKGLNHSEVEIRKAALDSLVSLYFVYHDHSPKGEGEGESPESFLSTISKYLTLSQQRILEIYIQKFQY